MQQVSLQALLEAGCHFGHKAERWHPKAHEFIYTEKDGIHIIDLAKTKAALEAAAEFIREVAARGDEVLFVGTKKQASDIVRAEADAVGAPYLVARWIGGFLTNWDSIKKNIEKVNRMFDERDRGIWKKFPKHEQAKLGRYLKRLNTFYGGVLKVTAVPAVLFVIDIRKEDAAVREAIRRGLPVVGLVDTNADPNTIDHPIPGNDDAVGSISLITHTIVKAYKEGKEAYQKAKGQEEAREAAARQAANEPKPTGETKVEKPEVAVVKEAAQASTPADKPVKRGRPKK